MNDEDSATATATAASTAPVAPPNRPHRPRHDADDVEPSPPPPFAAETTKPLSEPKQQQQSDIMILSRDASVMMKLEDSTTATDTDTAAPPSRPPRLRDDADHVEPSPLLPVAAEKAKPLSEPKQRQQSTIGVPCKDAIDVENSITNTATPPVDPPNRPPRLPDDEPSLPPPFAAEIRKPLSAQTQQQQQPAITIPSKTAIDVEASATVPAPVAPPNRPPRLPDDVDVKPSLLLPFASERTEPLSEAKQQQQQSTIMIPSRDPDALYSGGGISFLNGSRNARFNYGYASFKGKRASMEDFFETRISEVDGQMVAFFGVFDGHGGSRTAEYLKDNLFKNLTSHPDFKKDTKTAIVEAFRQTDADYLSGENPQQRDAGSTASTALLMGDRLLVANVGDSRVVACRAGSAVPLSIDHKPDRSDERERIEQAGGFIIWAGTWRVGGVLAVSRAFGDKLLKPYVVAEPEIQEEEIKGFEFLIIASDGLWNVISNKDAVAIVQEMSDAEAASRKLIQESYTRGSSDNITCIVVRFDNP